MDAGKDYDTARDIPDLSGKVILITGGTAGLGKETIVTLAKHNPSHIYFTGRNTKNAHDVIEAVEKLGLSTKMVFIECDFTSLDAVEKAAKGIVGQSGRLDILLCNAGVMALPAGMTKDGYELQFGINHIAHASLIDLLLPALLQTAKEPGSDVRIVITSSDGYRLASGIAFNKLHTSQDAWIGGPLSRYAQSKLANVLYAQELARHHPSITSVSIHPGVIATGLISNSTWWMQKLVDLTAGNRWVTLEEGVKNGLWAATVAKEKIVNGAYYEPVGVPAKMTAAAKNSELAEELWTWTQDELNKWKTSD